MATKNRQNKGFKDPLSLNAGQKYCRIEHSLQYFRPSLSYHLSLRSLFCLFLSVRFTQILHVLGHANSIISNWVDHKEFIISKSEKLFTLYCVINNFAINIFRVIDETCRERMLPLCH